MQTSDPRVCQEANPESHYRMMEIDGRCSICGTEDSRYGGTNERE